MQGNTDPLNKAISIVYTIFSIYKIKNIYVLYTFISVGISQWEKWILESVWSSDFEALASFFIFPGHNSTRFRIWILNLTKNLLSRIVQFQMRRSLKSFAMFMQSCRRWFIFHSSYKKNQMYRPKTLIRKSQSRKIVRIQEF